MSGWTGKLLRVNLTQQRCQVEDIPEAWLRDYIGGRGVGDRYLWQELDPRVEPLSPDNKLIFASGPLTGTPVSCGARYMVVTKGPLTGAITTSNSGGHWGPELKFAGYDLLILEGRAAKPVYLFIYDDVVQIRDAAAFWGKTTSETEDGIRKELGIPGVRVAGIGPAGERLVRFACIINDKHRAAGRSGVGAVMGSKNCKAVAVRGTRGLRIAKPAEFMKAVWAMRKKLADSPARQGMTELGTASTIDLTNAFGGCPTRNFETGQFEHAENLNGNSIKDQRMVANKACFACTIACGIVTDNQVELPLRFGSAEALVRMTEATAYREGFGNELAEGSKRMGAKFQHPEVFMGVKGQEFPAYDPRGFQGMGIAYATCNRGACHLRAWTPGIESSGKYDPHTPVGKAEWVAVEQNRTTSHDATGVCLFTGLGASLENLVACTAAATGVPYTLEDFVKAGERTWNLERLWNLKAGLKAADDTLPKRLLKEAHPSGPAKGVVVHLDQ